VSLAGRTSLKVGGLADWYSEPADLECLQEDIDFAATYGIPVKVIGGGSNLLISDEGIEGLVIRPLMQLRSLEKDGDEAVMRVGAGASIGALARSLARQGWSGLEWAATVPGCVGGAVVNNAGAFGSSTADCLLSATLIVDGEGARTLSATELGYGYRTSSLKRGELRGIVLEARFRLHQSSPAEAQRMIVQFQAQRTATQPRILSAGSVFANPPGDFSGRLLEAAGAKGMRQGAAEISQQHANFIVNHGGATARDVFEVMVAARDLVAEKFGIHLNAEIELAGRWNEHDRHRLHSDMHP
jgi:UDP-N-acetylmuramate dehydrogenase